MDICRFFGCVAMRGGISALFLVLGAIYLPIVRWRLRIFARDLANGISPDLTKSSKDKKKEEK
jgi:hypothetical protein